MKKFLVLATLLASVVFVAPSAKAADAKASELTANNAAGQIRVQIGPQNRRNRRWNNRRYRRTYLQTRNVRVGRRIYRETYRVTQQPNGRTRVRLISRVLVGRY